MPPKRNKDKKVDTSEAKTESPKKGGKKKGGGGSKRYDIIQKGLVKGEDTTVGTFESQAACQREVERLVAESNRSLKLHDFEIVPSK